MISTAHAQPRIVLWAWERHEDFRFLDARPSTEIAVAPVIVRLRLEGERARATWRRQRLNLPVDVPVLPVVHVDANSHRDPPQLNLNQQESIVQAVLSVSARFPGKPVQLDFEVRRSQRAFYRDLIVALKRRAPDLSLSATALSSWCMDDRWLESLPLDEVVPMAFRMGRDAEKIRLRLREDGRLPAAPCGRALGISLDEWRPTRYGVATIYVFSPRPWTRDAHAPI